MFEHALRSASSSQALIACSHMYHDVNLWRSRTVDTPRILRVRGHRTPEYQRAPQQHDELHRYYNLCLHRPSSSGVVPIAMGYHMDSRCVLRGDHLGKIWTGGLHQQRRVEGNLKPRRLWQIVTGAVTRWRNQALIHCWRPPGVHYSSIKSLVPYTERQMGQRPISSQQPGDSTSPSTFRHAA